MDESSQAPTGKQEVETASVFDVLARGYLNVYLIGLEDGSAQVLKLNGYVTEGLNPQNIKPFFYPDILRQYIKDRVHPEDQESLSQRICLETLQRVFANRDDYMGNYRVLIDGETHHYQYNYGKVAGGKHVVAGFQNIDDIIDEHEAQQKEMAEQTAIISTLASSYRNVYLADLDTGDARVVKLASDYDVRAVRDTNNQTFHFDAVVDRWVRENVHPDDKDRIKETLNMANLNEVFAKQTEMLGTYRSLDGGEYHYYQYDFRKIIGTNRIVAGFKIVDDIVAQRTAEEEAHRKELEDQFAIIDALSRDYMTIYLANLEDGTAEAIRVSSDYAYKKMSDLVGSSFPFETAIQEWANTCLHPDDRNRLLKSISVDNLRRVFSTLDEYSGNYRSCETGDFCNYQFDIRRVDESHVVAGFRNIDSIIAEHLEREKEQREHAEVISSLSKIYSTIFRADLDTHWYKVLNSVALMDDVAGSGGASWDVVMDKVIGAFMAPEFRQKMHEFLDLGTLNARMANVNTVMTEYKDPNGRWFQARFIAKRRDAEGRLHEVLYVARDFTSEKEVELTYQDQLAQALADTQRDKEDLLATQAQLRDSMAVNDALSRDYSNVFLVQPKKNLGKTVKEENYNVDGIHQYDGTWFDYTFFIRKYIESRVYESDVQMMLEKTSLSRVMEEIESKSDFSIPFRAFVGDDIHYLQMRYVSVEGSDLVAVGFRYVDDVVEAEQEQKRLLQEALAAAQQANKAKSTFLNSMSHDIRTPMNAIIGFTALAQTHSDNPEQVQDYLSKISTSSTHLLSLINDILDMSRIESGTVKLDEKPVHIPDLLHDLRTMIQGLVNSKNQGLFIDTQDVVHEDVICDKLRLNQILINIVGNAVKFTQNGGDIIIRLVEKPCSIKHHTTFEFSVKDNGIGMSKEFLEHIFDTFSRERSATVSGIQGTGLGMAITKNIVEMMGGDIAVESEEGKGSVFTVTLNLRLANEPVLNEPIPELLGARALVVDDDLNTCRSVSKMLRDIQMRPDWTASGKEAIVRAQDAAELKDEYKVYIVDYLMPDMNGIETVRRIRKVISEDVPIIVLTAYDWEDFEDEAREAGVTAFVSKPIFMSELREVLTHPAGHSESDETDEQVARSYDYSGKHVLLAEDNELNREIACAILGETGMTIESVNDGDEAVAAVHNAPAGTYDLVLMDVQMPRMDGYTATREIRTLKDSEKANIPIVAMTANAFEEDRRKAFESGMNGHIIKPISIDAIAKVLDPLFEE